VPKFSEPTALYGTIGAKVAKASSASKLTVVHTADAIADETRFRESVKRVSVWATPQAT